jgi:hypothetical protein
LGTADGVAEDVFMVETEERHALFYKMLINAQIVQT